MTKRRLTKKQVRNQAKITADRLRRAKLSDDKISESLESGDLGSEQLGLLIAHHGVRLIVEDEDGVLHNCKCRSNLGLLATGDNVVFRLFNDGTGVIVAIEPRRSVLERPTYRKEVRPTAANVEQLMIVMAVEPPPLTLSLDRYLVIAELMNLPAVIVVNKIDLLSSDTSALNELMAYKELGYDVYQVSRKTGEGLDAIEEALKDKVSIFLGQSGVGKSSLINAIIPDVDIQVGALSNQTLLGKHTTTCSRLYHLPKGGSLIDSPGIRRFGLWHLEKEDIVQGFRELLPLAERCQFRNCSHTHEPGCALIQAVKDGHVSEQRFENYHRICETHQMMNDRR